MKSQFATKTTVWITTSFVGFHRWKDAPETQEFLREWHRHVFHVKVGVGVAHQNRDVEFFALKQYVEEYLDTYRGKEFEDSCEMIAASILGYLSVGYDLHYVEVSEDGENGATVMVPSLRMDDGDKRTQAQEPKPQLVAEQFRTKCFVGTEAEGPNKGKRVLFVPGSVTPERFLKVWAEWGGKTNRVYYGAGNDRVVREDTLKEIVSTCTAWNRSLDIEVNQKGLDSLFSVLNTNANTILFGPAGPPTKAFEEEYADEEMPTFFKWIDDQEIVWKSAVSGTLYRTPLNDPLFAKDQFVE